MPRPQRIEYENAWYHVENRGSGNRPIFTTQAHIHCFSDLLQDCQKQFGIEIHAACLLPTGYHLLIRTPRANLSQAMRHLNGLYTQRFNKSVGSDGAIFRSRYRATVLADTYILPISRYIHWQPVLHGLAKSVIQYKWSSHRVYLGKQAKPKWLTSNFLAKASENYLAYVAKGIDEECAHFFAQKKRPAVLGDFQFKQQLSKQHAAVHLPNQPTGPSIELIMQQTAALCQIPVTQLQKSRRGQINLPRTMAIYLSRSLGGHILTEIAKHFSGISHAAVGTAVKRFELQLKQDPNLRDTLKRLETRIADHAKPLATETQSEPNVVEHAV